MSRLYRYESDSSFLINLDTSSDEILQERQTALNKLIARATLDLQVITEELVARRSSPDVDH